MHPLWNNLEELVDHPEFRFEHTGWDSDDHSEERQFVRIGYGNGPDVEFEMSSGSEVEARDALYNLQSDAVYTADGYTRWCLENGYWDGDENKKQIFRDMQSSSKGLRQVFRHLYKRLLTVPECAA